MRLACICKLCQGRRKKREGKTERGKIRWHYSRNVRSVRKGYPLKFQINLLMTSSRRLEVRLGGFL